MLKLQLGSRPGSDPALWHQQPNKPLLAARTGTFPQPGCACVVVMRCYNPGSHRGDVSHFNLSGKRPSFWISPELSSADSHFGPEHLQTRCWAASSVLRAQEMAQQGLQGWERPAPPRPSPLSTPILLVSPHHPPTPISSCCGTSSGLRVSLLPLLMLKSGTLSSGPEGHGSSMAYSAKSRSSSEETHGFTVCK